MPVDYLQKILTARVYDVAVETPLELAPTLSRRLGNRVLLKREDQQSVFSFKLRGAYNKMAHLSPEQRAKGVIAASAGNHAQGVALAAQKMGCRAVIVMPVTTPQLKVDAVRGRGAEVVLYGDSYSDAYTRALELQQAQDLAFVHPFDDPDVIAGQGTAAKELFDEVGPLDAVFAPLGGGGLLSGTALSTRALSPHATLYGVEPEAGNDGQQSFRSGAIVRIDTPRTIADGAQTQYLGNLTFPIIRRDVDDILTATDAELVDCMRFFATRMKIVVEPTGCLSFAAVRRMKDALQGKRVGVVISGGNVDLENFCALVSAPA